MLDELSLHNVITGDSLQVLSEMEDNSIDSIVTDPPYGIFFMNAKWDHYVPKADLWSEALRVLKPGGHLLSFFGSRTYHRGAVEIEDAGFEIRDQIMWHYQTGFPKNHDVSKAIDKMAGAEREVVGTRKVSSSDLGQNSGWNDLDTSSGVYEYTVPTTPDAKTWEGWGTALKPAHEPIVVARKPLEGTVAKNVLKYGTGGINIDECRIGVETQRYPSNFIHDGSDTTTGALPGDSQKFFYCAKPSRKEREEGLDSFTPAKTNDGRAVDADNPYQRGATERKNTHPTVKPVKLMRYLCRLITPPGGVVLDPFMGSGTTGIAAVQEGFQFIGIEREQEYAAIAEARIRSAC